MISLLMQNNVTATITVGRVPFIPASGPIASTMRLLGSHGFLTVDENQPELEFWGSDGAQRYQPIGGDAITVAFETEIKEFISNYSASRSCWRPDQPNC